MLTLVWIPTQTPYRVHLLNEPLLYYHVAMSRGIGACHNVTHYSDSQLSASTSLWDMSSVQVFIEALTLAESEFMASLPNITRIIRKKQVNESQPSYAECPICLQDVERHDHFNCFLGLGSAIQTRKCKHDFHVICLRKWLLITENCPLCRAPLHEEAVLLNWLHTTT